MWWTCYRCLIGLLAPLVRLRRRWRGLRDPAYNDHVAERYGYVPEGLPTAALWLHCVSAGETIAAAPMARELAARRSVVITATTPTGRAEALRLLGDCCSVCYAPYDLPAAVERFLNALQPSALVLMETELWPFMIRFSAERGLPVLLVNGRLSARSAGRYARLRGFTRAVLGYLNWVGVQFEADAERFRRLGVVPGRLTVTGSVKFDQPPPQQPGADVRGLLSSAALAERAVWLAGSTHAGEEALVLDAHRSWLERHPGGCLLLVPRHPERCTEVAKLAKDLGFSLCLASDPRQPDVADVLLVDRMGWLRELYAAVDVAFVGGSIAPVGGHNPIEAVLAGSAVLMGPSRHNFSSVCEGFARCDCLRTVSSAATLLAALEQWHAAPDQRIAAVTVGQALIADSRGATRRTLAGIEAALQAAAVSAPGGQ